MNLRGLYKAGGAWAKLGGWEEILSKCKKSEKTSECQFTRKRVKTTQKQLLSTRKREKWEKKWDFSLEKEWKKSESEHEWTPLENILSSV